MSRRILLIDFDRRALSAAQAKLEAEGFEVLCAQSGKEAEQVLRGTKIDLVVLEPMIPGLDGFKFCTAMKRREFGPAPYVILASRIYRAPRYRAMAKDAGADLYAERPQQDHILLETARRLLPPEAAAEAGAPPVADERAPRVSQAVPVQDVAAPRAHRGSRREVPPAAAPEPARHASEDRRPPRRIPAERAPAPAAPAPPEPPAPRLSPADDPLSTAPRVAIQGTVDLADFRLGSREDGSDSVPIADVSDEEIVDALDRVIDLPEDTAICPPVDASAAPAASAGAWFGEPAPLPPQPDEPAAPASSSFVSDAPGAAPLPPLPGVSPVFASAAAMGPIPVLAEAGEDEIERMLDALSPLENTEAFTTEVAAEESGPAEDAGDVRPPPPAPEPEELRAPSAETAFEFVGAEPPPAWPAEPEGAAPPDEPAVVVAAEYAPADEPAVVVAAEYAPAEEAPAVVVVAEYAPADEAPAWPVAVADEAVPADAADVSLVRDAAGPSAEQAAAPTDVAEREEPAAPATPAEGIPLGLASALDRLDCAGDLTSLADDAPVSYTTEVDVEAIAMPDLPAFEFRGERAGGGGRSLDNVCEFEEAPASGGAEIPDDIGRLFPGAEEDVADEVPAATALEARAAALEAEAPGASVEPAAVVEEARESIEQLVEPAAFVEEPRESSEQVVEPAAFVEEPRESSEQVVEPAAFVEEPRESSEQVVEPAAFVEERPEAVASSEEPAAFVEEPAASEVASPRSLVDEPAAPAAAAPAKFRFDGPTPKPALRPRPHFHLLGETEDTSSNQGFAPTPSFDHTGPSSPIGPHHGVSAGVAPPGPPPPRPGAPAAPPAPIGQWSYQRFVAPRPAPAPVPATASSAPQQRFHTGPDLDSQLDRAFAGQGGQSDAARGAGGDGQGGTSGGDAEDPAEPILHSDAREFDPATAALLSSLEGLDAVCREDAAEDDDLDQWLTDGGAVLDETFPEEFESSPPCPPPPTDDDERSLETLLSAPVERAAAPADEEDIPDFWTSPTGPADVEPVAGPLVGPRADDEPRPDDEAPRGTAPSAPPLEEPTARSMGLVLSAAAVLVVLIGVGSGALLLRGAGAAPAAPAAIRAERASDATPAAPDATRAERASVEASAAGTGAAYEPTTPASERRTAAASPEPAPAAPEIVRPVPRAVSDRLDGQTARPTPRAAVGSTAPELARPAELDRPLERVAGEIPAEAAHAAAPGKAVLSVLVGPDGDVRDVRLMSDPGQGLGEAARRAVAGWRYTAPRRAGEPVQVWRTETVSFGRP
ncbi:TonB family protein [bacterium]|nr:TonB family protein [bacterium]